MQNKKRHRGTEQTFGLCGRRPGWDVLKEQHVYAVNNMYNIILCIICMICILSIVKQTTSPGWMHEASARAWCTGKTQRNRVEKEVGGGDRDGEYM